MSLADAFWISFTYIPRQSVTIHQGAYLCIGRAKIKLMTCDTSCAINHSAGRPRVARERRGYQRLRRPKIRFRAFAQPKRYKHGRISDGPMWGGSTEIQELGPRIAIPYQYENVISHYYRSGRDARRASKSCISISRMWSMKTGTPQFPNTLETAKWMGRQPKPR